MHDFDFDVMQKKQIARSARHRVCGSKSKKCGLPSDHITEAQWKKRNGSVVTMNLNVPMNWQEFKKLPNDLQKEYVMNVIKKFSCKINNFADLFGVHRMTVKKKMVELGIDMSLFKPGERMNEEQRETFEAWACPVMKKQSASQDTNSNDDSHIEEDPKTDTLNQFEKMALPLNSMDHLEIEYSGVINFSGVLMALYQFAGNSPVKLKISMDKVEDHV